MKDGERRKFPIIKVDTREEPAALAGILEEGYGIQMVREYLTAGDFLIRDTIAVEYKKTIDFARSLVDGRLFKQVGNMQKRFACALMIVEGGDLYTCAPDVHANALRGALVNLALRWRCPVLFAKDPRETALLLSLIARQSVYHPQKVRSFRTCQPKKRHRQQVYILQGFSGIGADLAVRLLRHFGTIEAVLNASTIELQAVRGIGCKKAQKIKQLIQHKHHCTKKSYN